MTITPLPLAPTAPGAAPATPATGGDGAHFGALVLAHLSRLAGDRAPAGVAPGDQAPAEGTGEPTGTGVGTAAGATVLPALQAAAAAQALCSAEQPAGSDEALLGEADGTNGTDETGETSVVEDGAPLDGLEPATDKGGTTATDPTVAATGAAAQANASVPPTALATGVAQLLAPPAAGPVTPGRSEATPATPAPADAAPTAANSAGTSAGEGRPASATGTEPLPGPQPGQPATPAPTGIVWQQVAPAAAVDGVTPTPAPAGDAGPLIDQVTPVVTRMVSAGEGSHRMVLRLHPADLGEVHLTVTVRGDDVDVTVAAGPEARELLAEGGGQLRSLLESIGRTTGQVVFRDLPGTPPVQPAAQTFLGQEAGAGTPDRSAAGAGADPDHADQAYRRPGGTDHDPTGDRTGARSGADHPNPTRAGAASAAVGRGALDVRI